MKFISLFAGIGGFDLGLERAGMVPVGQVEINKQCQRVLTHHWPGVRKGHDITKIKGSVGYAGLLCGGFPCQDLSVAGNRAGLGGERSGMFFQFVRLLAEFRPGWVLIENVPGLLSSNGGRDMGTVLGCLGKLGYGWAYRVLDSQYFNLAQRRARVFIVGCLGDPTRAGKVLFEPESLHRDSPPQRGEGKGTPETTGNGIAQYCVKGAADCRSLDAGPQYGEVLSDGTVYTLQTNEVHCVTALGHASGDRPAGMSKGMRGTEGVDSNWMVVFQNDSKITTSADTAYVGVCASGHPYVCHGLRGEAHDASEDGTGRGTPIIAQPLRSNVYNNSDLAMEASQHLLTTMGVRRLTPLECCRLQGFPDDWLELDPPLSDGPKYRMLGNAVSVPVIEWIGRRIMAQNSAL